MYGGDLAPLEYGWTLLRMTSLSPAVLPYVGCNVWKWTITPSNSLIFSRRWYNYRIWLAFDCVTIDNRVMVGSTVPYRQSGKVLRGPWEERGTQDGRKIIYVHFFPGSTEIWYKAWPHSFEPSKKVIVKKIKPHGWLFMVRFYQQVCVKNYKIMK